MNTQITFEAPTQAEVDRFIAQAHQMRREYFASVIKSGLSALYRAFSGKGGFGRATA